MMVKTTLRDYLQTTEEEINSGQLAAALTSCQKILKQYPSSLEAQRLLGEIYLAQDQFEQARQTFDWILVNDPENVLVYCDRAIMSEKLADIDTALDCYQQAYELSRGNRDIRQQFNQLSTRVGQQGFMLSRAGLARLYMRGDLLSQAIQEWETVLSSTPDRLDARTGLMEACWREGLYERTEELASQLLEEYPANLKALLLLAYTTSIHNMARAQELLQRARALDPDLIITQELFRELAINQPADPFLPLLKKEPNTLQEQDGPSNALSYGFPAAEAASTRREHTPVPTSQDNQLFDWQHPENFPGQPHNTPAGGLDIPEITPAPNANLDPWNQPNQNDKSWQPYSSFSGIGTDGFTIPEQGQQNIPSNDPAWYRDAMSYNENASPEHGWGSQDAPNNPDDLPSFHSSTSTGTTNHRTNAPAWLDMLNVNDFAQTTETPFEAPAPTDFKSAPAPTPPPTPEIENVAPTPQPPALKPEPQKPAEPEKRTAPEEPTPFFFGEEDSENDMSWPEWLKSLGATEMDPNQPSTTMAPITPEDIEQYRQAQANATSNESTPPQKSRSGSLNPDSAFNGLISPQSLNEPQATNAHTATSEPQHAPEFLQPTTQPEQPKHEAFTTSFETLSPEEFSPVLSAESLQSLTPTYPNPNPTDRTWQQEIEQPANFNQNQLEPSQPQAMAKDETEQRLLATLESLEQNLLSQGFVPMTGSLSHLAQQLQDQPSVSNYSSAFTELGATNPGYNHEPQNTNDGSEPQPQVYPFQHEPVHTTPEEDTVEKTIDPLAFRSTSYETNEPAQSPTYTSTWMEQAPETPAYSPFAAFERQQQDFNTQPAWQQTPEVPQEQPAFSQPAPEPSVRSQPVPEQPALKQPVSEPQNDLEKTISAYYTETSQHQAIKKPDAANPVPGNSVAPTDPGKTPTYRNDALLDGELETTMKRPAIRLQSIHQRGHGDRPQSLLSRARSANQLADSTSNSNKDRLLRGYQFQLSGAYDEAMGEYRLIIRNAPELLGEVISNMRALLKLAPKYAAGYRVLGDAYMRQGEYLQAMEAYNKALAMTQKAKGN